MRIPFLSMFMTSPFVGLQEHAEKVEEFRQEVHRLEHDADAVKRRIRGHLPKGTLLPVDKFQLFRYLREQDRVLDSVEEALDWISYRSEPGIPEELQKDFFLLVDAVVEPIEELSRMVSEARKYFRNFSEKQRVAVKDIIRNLRRQEHEADVLEDQIKKKVFNSTLDPVTVFHIVRLAETVGSIADHAENAGDMMRAMVAR
jgi:predicted phosphate transport protein (TIGR00153 family)